MVDIKLITDKLLEQSILYAPKLIGAILILFVGLWLIKRLTKILRKVFDKKEFDKALETFLLSLISIGLKILLFIVILSMIGVEMTSFAALLAGAGLAIGMALSGNLSNFAGGVLILIFKPFKVGDYIKAQGESGSVNEIAIFHTILKTPDNKTIIIPNGALSNGNIINYSAEEFRRVDFLFGISYGDNIDKDKKIIEKIIKKDKRVILDDEDKEPKIVISELADSSVNITVRVWAKREDYWDVKFETLEEVKKQFDDFNITIPFPQQDVNIKR